MDRNTAIDMFRRWGNTDDIVEDIMALGLSPEAEQRTVGQALQHRQKMTVWIENALTDREQEVIAMRYDDGLGWPSIAKVLGKCPAQVKIIHAEAVKKLMGGQANDA